MRRTGRMRILAASATFPQLIQLFAYITFAASSDYGVPIEIKLWDAGRSPLAHMVDVTNGFGLKVLAEHNFLNDNNIAFSPYGLMGILVALYEGVDGESSFQIQRAMQLPWNRNVMRVGFRDIHRTLKTYFVPEEGFLAGLALNNENVTFNENYKKILRFYGFDLDNEQPPQDNSSTTIAPTTKSEASSESNMFTTTSSTMVTSETTTATVTDIDIRENTSPVSSTETAVPSSSMPSEVLSTSNTETTDMSMSTTASPEATATESQSTTTVGNLVATTQTEPIPTTTSSGAMTTTTAVTTPSNLPSITSETTTVPRSTIPDAESLSTQISQSTAALTNDPAFDAETIEQQTSQATVALMNEATSNNNFNDPTTVEATPSTTVVATEATTTTASADSLSTSVMSSTSLVTEINTISTAASDSISTDLPSTDNLSTTDVTSSSTLSESTITNSESALETLQRRKKSIVDFIFTNPPYFEDYVYYKSYDIPPVVPNTNLNNKMFLVNGLKNVQVAYMQYDTVLEHAYLPHLEASALRLPLDSERYYLLVVLPRRGGEQELGRLLNRMARESDLSDVYNALRPRRVRGLVPSFTVKGHVALTTDLQKLGIRDVFEPRQRDFTPMTPQVGVYVRSIEQAVSVAIRKYRPDDHKKNRYVTNRNPVKFYATYPFLYFVMDSTIHVSLMAGKMVDPLNSRIL